VAPGGVAEGDQVFVWRLRRDVASGGEQEPAAVSQRRKQTSHESIDPLGRAGAAPFLHKPIEPAPHRVSVWPILERIASYQSAKGHIDLEHLTALPGQIKNVPYSPSGLSVAAFAVWSTD